MSTITVDCFSVVSIEMSERIKEKSGGGGINYDGCFIKV